MTGSAEGNLLKVPINLSLNQQPISGATGAANVSTGAFFGIPEQAEFQGAHNLLGSSNFQVSGNGLMLLGGAALLVALLAKR